MHIPGIDTCFMNNIAQDKPLKKSTQLLLSNVMTACKRNNMAYLERNRDRIDRRLLEMRATQDGNTPLYMAVESSHLAIVRYLLGMGVDVNGRKNQCGNSALHKSFQNQDYEMVVLLITNGANMD